MLIYNALMYRTVYSDNDIIVCVKPSGITSDEGDGGIVELIRRETDYSGELFVVHRLDREASGLMVLAKNSSAASNLNRQIAERTFDKYYLAAVHGVPEEKSGRFDDLLFRDIRKNKTYAVDRMRKGVRTASLEYEVLETEDGLSLVKIRLLTGRTHQIRVQFASRQMPLAGDSRYGAKGDDCDMALMSVRLGFNHPSGGGYMSFSALPEDIPPWNIFNTADLEID